MRKTICLLAVILTINYLVSKLYSQSNPHWIDPAHDADAMSQIKSALKRTHYAGIGKVGQAGEHLLVMAVYKNISDDTPKGRPWRLYDLNRSTLELRNVLSSAYNPTFAYGLGPNHDEIAIKYWDCYACEAGTRLAIVRYIAGQGWITRWASKKTPKNPAPIYSELLEYFEEDGPSDDSYAYALFNPYGAYTLAVWERSRNFETHKITDTVFIDTIQPELGGETDRILKGAVALQWRQRLCNVNPKEVLFYSAPTKADCRRTLKK